MRAAGGKLTALSLMAWVNGGPSLKAACFHHFMLISILSSSGSHDLDLSQPFAPLLSYSHGMAQEELYKAPPEQPRKKRGRTRG
jgi:hypothetical protein